MRITFLGADLFVEKMRLGDCLVSSECVWVWFHFIQFWNCQIRTDFLKTEFILMWVGNGGYHQVLPVLTLYCMLNRTLLLHLIISICTLLHVFVDFCSIYQCLILLFFSEWIFPRFFKFFCVCWILLVFFCWFFHSFLSQCFYHRVARIFLQWALLRLDAAILSDNASANCGLCCEEGTHHENKNLSATKIVDFDKFCTLGCWKQELYYRLAPNSKLQRKW